MTPAPLPAVVGSSDARWTRFARAYANSLEVLAGAIGRHDGCNMLGRDILASRSPDALRYTRQAADVLDDVRLGAGELAAAARRAVADNVLFDGPHDRPEALDDHEPTRRLLDLVVACGAQMAEALS